ncbi:hypothetical protein [Ammoniphilus resinae]|uniref:Molybdopterin-guanine dinucleotide biosynthesis protein A n=1 Tax=Ammoniphilus resinae TaxID=861532 RepID=A0ABS4GNI8_9BACL|nr:hypothetical protein [Ammoniphilus resinae]MBP1931838.1 molybdopterin-guanine dinucleotide biosynthesis protein A [Ammoniphilus resinae]
MNGLVRKPSVKLSTISTEPFDCCSHWAICEMGKKPCVYQENDPDYSKLCACYRRYLKNELEENVHKDPVKVQTEIQPTSLDELQSEEQRDIFFDMNGQGQLF